MSTNNIYRWGDHIAQKREEISVGLERSLAQYNIIL